MIRIMPLKSGGELDALNEKEGTAAKLAYYLEVEGVPCDYILYNLTSEQGIIQAISAREDAIADVLVRAVFSSLFDFGLNKVTFNNRLDNALLTRLQFVKEGEWVTPSLEYILFECKPCKKIEN